MTKKILTSVLLFICVIAPFGCQRSAGIERPTIGITSVFEDNNSSKKVSVSYNYVQAVLDNGGIPVILPTIDNPQVISQYVHQIDGLVLIGGLDIPPAVYGHKSHQTVEPLPQLRYEFESRLIRQFLDTKKPVLGVCLGMQFTNVVRGGSLIQDIPSQVTEPVTHRGENSWHKVTIERNSLLETILSANEAYVYSSHHQAVNDLGKNLKVIARSGDGVIEALERTDGGFGLFVQWHPEAMTDDPVHRDAIYGALVRACSKK